MKEFAEKFYKSKRWLCARSLYIEQRMAIDGGLCEECHEEQGYIVHHKIMLTIANIDDPEVTLNPDNMMFVCKRCHDAFEGHGVGKKKTKLKVRFDADGYPIL